MDTPCVCFPASEKEKYFCSQLASHIWTMQEGIVGILKKKKDYLFQKFYTTLCTYSLIIKAQIFTINVKKKKKVVIFF